MLGFFRRYQRYFFLLITIVIVISFSFFGTYSSLRGPASSGEAIAFVAVDGTAITRQELDEMVLFIATDSDEKLLFGGRWGPNFLNDGVINKEILQSGILELLATRFAPQLAEEIGSKHRREKSFTPYVHPKAPFISAINAWGYFAPEVKSNFTTLQQAADPLAAEAIQSRVQLFLAERRFPTPLLAQVLRYQEKQQSWLPHDENLDRQDLSLFGYFTLEDWFGPRLMRLIAQYIINSSIVAEQHGYTVSREEASADLMRNSELSFRQNARSPYRGVKNSWEYFSEQLRRLNMDQRRAVKIWQRVLLFRRLFHDLGSSTFVAPESFSDFVSYAKEPFNGIAYELPQHLHLGEYRSLQKLEFYLDAVAPRSGSDKQNLTLPMQFRTAEKVAKEFPELVHKRYLLDIATYDKKALQGKVSIKEMWSWEGDERNWAVLKKEFPILAIERGESREERFAALDSLEESLRSQVDTFAREKIVNEHPEWLTDALANAERKRSSYTIPIKGKTSLPGFDDGAALIALLDKAAVATGAETSEVSGALSNYSADGRHYYEIAVIDRAPALEIVTFRDASSSNLLDKLLDRHLESYYEEIREKNGELFKLTDNKGWKPFADVKELVADFYFAPTLKAIAKEISTEKGTEKISGSRAAPLRLIPHVTMVREALEKGLDKSAYIIEKQTEDATEDNNKLIEAAPLEQQWKLEKSAFQLDRSTPSEQYDLDALIALSPGSWSPVRNAPNGRVYFFQRIDGKEGSQDQDLLLKKSDEAYRLLGREIQRSYGGMLIDQFNAKGALSLDYLNTSSEGRLSQ